MACLCCKAEDARKYDAGTGPYCPECYNDCPAFGPCLFATEG